MNFKDTSFSLNQTVWEFHGKRLDFSAPLIMGILNVTPDSFFDGGKYDSEMGVLTRVEKMLQDGADIIDLGGYSTRPGANDVEEAEEINRIVPSIAAITKRFPQAILSIDTFRSNVAKAAFENGATIINDVSGGTLDDKMFETAYDLKMPYVLMHMRGTPQTMQNFASYNNIATEVINELYVGVKELHRLGHKHIILDPGFGFAKTIDHNFELLKKLDEFGSLKLPLLVGVSRKSTIWKKLGVSANEALNGTTVLNTVALMNGANVLRVHDVKEAKEAIILTSSL